VLHRFKNVFFMVLNFLSWLLVQVGVVFEAELMVAAEPWNLQGMLLHVAVHCWSQQRQ
jgi:hypothetical protein